MSAFETYLLDRCGNEGSHTLESYRRHGGYAALEKILREGHAPEQVVAQARASRPG